MADESNSAKAGLAVKNGLVLCPECGEDDFYGCYHETFIANRGMKVYELGQAEYGSTDGTGSVIYVYLECRSCGYLEDIDAPDTPILDLVNDGLDKGTIRQFCQLATELSDR